MKSAIQDVNEHHNTQDVNEHCNTQHAALSATEAGIAVLNDLQKDLQKKLRSSDRKIEQIEDKSEILPDEEKTAKLGAYFRANQRIDKILLATHNSQLSMLPVQTISEPSQEKNLRTSNSLSLNPSVDGIFQVIDEEFDHFELNSDLGFSLNKAKA